MSVVNLDTELHITRKLLSEADKACGSQFHYHVYTDFSENRKGVMDKTTQSIVPFSLFFFVVVIVFVSKSRDTRAEGTLGVPFSVFRRTGGKREGERGRLSRPLGGVDGCPQNPICVGKNVSSFGDECAFILDLGIGMKTQRKEPKRALSAVPFVALRRISRRCTSLNHYF